MCSDHVILPTSLMFSCHACSLTDDLGFVIPSLEKTSCRPASKRARRTFPFTAKGWWLNKGLFSHGDSLFSKTLVGPGLKNKSNPVMSNPGDMLGAVI